MVKRVKLPSGAVVVHRTLYGQERTPEEVRKLVEKMALQDERFRELDALYQTAVHRANVLKAIIPTISAEHRPGIQALLNKHAENAGKLLLFRGEVLGQIERKLLEMSPEEFKRITLGVPWNLILKAGVKITKYVALALAAYWVSSAGEKIVSDWRAVKESEFALVREGLIALKEAGVAPEQIADYAKQKIPTPTPIPWEKYLLYAGLAAGGLYLAGKILPELLKKREVAPTYIPAPAPIPVSYLGKFRGF